MNQQYVPSGTNPEFSSDDIVTSELHKLKEYRSSVAQENQKYVDGHPEFQKLLDDFVSAVVTHKPSDLVKFGLFYFGNLRKNGKFGPCPIVVAGPSGVGKGTIINRLIATFPDVFGFSVSHTTRAARPGEVDGVHYNFVTKGEFEEAVERDDFVEYAKVHTNYYGTSFQAIERIRAQNKICILDIDVQGCANVKKSKLDCKYIFISPPSIKELENRLRGRNTETAEKIKVRLENAVGEMAYSQVEGNFDGIIINDNLDKCFENVVRTLQGWFPELDLYLSDVK